MDAVEAEFFSFYLEEGVLYKVPNCFGKHQGGVLVWVEKNR